MTIVLHKYSFGHQHTNVFMHHRTCYNRHKSKNNDGSELCTQQYTIEVNTCIEKPKKRTQTTRSENDAFL